MSEPANCHTRSETLQRIARSNETSNALLASTTIVNGHDFDLVEPISVKTTALTAQEPFTGAPLTEPTKSQRPDPTEQIRSTRDCPTLVTQTSESKPHPTHTFIIPTIDSPAQSEKPEKSPEQSGDSSITRSQRSAVLTGEKNAQDRIVQRGSKLASWFKGESEPISISIVPSPTKENVDPIDNMLPSSDFRVSSLLQRNYTAQTTQKPAKPTMASRLSFLMGKSSAPKPTPQLFDANDELFNIDISTLLIPTGSTDPSSLAAYKKLQQQAEGLLLRLQTAYKERTISLRHMTVEKRTLVQQFGSETQRADFLVRLKDEMATKFAEREKAMMNLVDELEQEKLALRQEAEARKRSVRLIEPATPPTSSHGPENLGDSGFESDEESSAESVFSITNGWSSPTTTMSPFSTPGSPELCHAPQLTSSNPILQPSCLRPTTKQSIKNKSDPLQDAIVLKPTPSSCAKRNGVSVSEAWDVVAILREENANLKARLEELQNGLDSCLDVVCAPYDALK